METAGSNTDRHHQDTKKQAPVRGLLVSPLCELLRVTGYVIAALHRLLSATERLRIPPRKSGDYMPDLYESRGRKNARENAALEILSVDELRKLIEQVEAAIVRYDRADLKITTPDALTPATVLPVPFPSRCRDAE
jgi:hypothetical protein